jgi:aminopeptidase N
VVALSNHPDFNLANPNRARSLLFAFAAGNPVAFHRADGEAYRFVGDRVMELDAINPQVASRIVSSFNQWRRFEPGRRALMKAELERIAGHSGISKDVSEIVDRALEG